MTNQATNPLVLVDSHARIVSGLKEEACVSQKDTEFRFWNRPFRNAPSGGASSILQLSLFTNVYQKARKKSGGNQRAQNGKNGRVHQRNQLQAYINHFITTYISVHLL